MIKVKDLIEQLSQYDGELGVLLQSDPEGNCYFFARGAEPAFVDKDDMKSDRTEFALDEEELVEEGYDSEDIEHNFEKIIVLFS